MSKSASDNPGIKNGRIIERDGEFFIIDDDIGEMYAMAWASPEAKAWFVAQVSPKPKVMVRKI